MFKMKTVNRKLGNEHVELVRGEGYFYFVYDNDDDLFETKSIYVAHLCELSVDQWVEIGQEFIKQVEDGTYAPNW